MPPNDSPADDERNESEPDTQPYRTVHDWAVDGCIGATIVGAVAALEGIEPEACPPLYDTIDPDALSELFRPTADGSPRTAGRVRFQYCGHEITVESSGEITIEAAEPTSQ